ncbi:25714_t:CDS:10 [Gigaspora margarita]|uniref:25714_t:CDS:1 n=1 Tax=Gigaspora margarita TaxID=4874 RepID=A0ABN7V008_GIGMA|nr:25714_t:CDS:10 [Gigaspora margarita]
MSDNIVLYCLVEKDSKQKAFEVKLEKNNNEVNIVLNDIQKTLELSNPTKKIGIIFTESIPDDSIQIIVERPSDEKCEKENENLKRHFNELVENLQKIWLQSEVAWFSAPGIPIATKKSKVVMEHGDCIGFPSKLTMTTLRGEYGKFREPPSLEVPEKSLQEYFVNECKYYRKPYFVFIAKGCPLDALHVIAVEELKKRSSNQFSNADIGQAVSFGKRWVAIPSNNYGMQSGITWMEYLSCYEKVKRVLEKLSNSPHIPKLLLHNENSLITISLGTKVRNLQKNDIKNIIETLRTVHLQNIIHMDLRIHNFIPLECMPDDILKSLVNGKQIMYSLDMLCKDILLDASQTSEFGDAEL